ncbi:MAG: SIS domain-containing protein [Sulfolobales archaeon]
MSLKQAYLSWDKMIRESINIEVVNKKFFSNKDLVYVSGMGGSGIVGEYVARIFGDKTYNFKEPIVLSNRSSETPINLLSKCDRALSIAVSYSGNTGETLCFLKKILSRNCDVGIVSSNGRLLEEAKKRSVPYYKVFQGYLPRASLPMLLVGVMKLIELLKIDLNRLYRDLERTISYMNEYKDLSNEIANELYEKIRSNERINIVFSSNNRYSPLIDRFKTEFAENTKLYVETPILPEAGHNYVETLPRGYKYVYYISDPDDAENQMLLGFLKKLSQRYENIVVNEIDLPEKEGYLTKIMIGSFIAGLVSVMLAEKLNIEASETPIIRLYREHSSEYYLAKEC